VGKKASKSSQEILGQACEATEDRRVVSRGKSTGGAGAKAPRKNTKGVQKPWEGGKERQEAPPKKGNEELYHEGEVRGGNGHV